MAAALPNYTDSDFSDDDMSPLDISFNNATEHVKRNTSKLNSNQLLQLYGLYKQATEGKCDTPKPGWFNTLSRKKWEAWQDIGDMSCDKAKEKYITLVEEYDPNWSNPQSTAGDGGRDTWVSVSTLRHSEDDLVQNESSLIDAAREDLADRVTKLLSENSDLKFEKDEDGLTALHWAADRDAIKSLKAALVGGCPVDARDESGQTALHYAVSCGHTESTKILINAGASLLEDEEGKTPLDLAENDEIRQILEGAK